MILSYHKISYHIISLHYSRHVMSLRKLVVSALVVHSLSASFFLSCHSCLIALNLWQSSKPCFTVSFCPHSYSSDSGSPIPFGYAFNWRFPGCIWAKTVAFAFAFAFAFERWRWSDNALVCTFGRALPGVLPPSGRGV